jgi:hypothetical protein
MRPALGTLVLLLALVGCEDDRGGVDGAPGVDPGVSGVTQVALLSATSAGGRVTTAPTRLPTDAAVRRYAGRFRSDRLGGEIIAAADQADVPEGRQLAAAVVAIGCDVPPRVVGTGTGDDIAVHAVLPSPNTKQCFAPITTVALVLLPE